LSWHIEAKKSGIFVLAAIEWHRKGLKTSKIANFHILFFFMALHEPGMKN
jgi:hypothetical protein